MVALVSCATSFYSATAQSMTVAGSNGSVTFMELNTVNSIVFTNNNLVIHSDDCGTRYFNVFTTDYLTLNGSVDAENGIQRDDALLIYPNPASDVLKLQCSSNLCGSYCVYNIVGKILYIGKIHGEMTEINIAEFSPGLYMIVVGDQTKTFTKL